MKHRTQSKEGYDPQLEALQQRLKHTGNDSQWTRTTVTSAYRQSGYAHAQAMVDAWAKKC